MPQDINEYDKDGILFQKTFNISNMDIYKAHRMLYKSGMQWAIVFVWAAISYYIGFGYFEWLTAVIYIPVFSFGLLILVRVVTPLASLLYLPWRKGRVGEHTVILKEKSFVEKTEYNKTSFPWDKIGPIYDRGNSLDIGINSDYFYIPKRDFSEEEWTEFRTILKENIGDTKYKIINKSILKFIGLFLLGLFSLLVIIAVSFGIKLSNQMLPEDTREELQALHKEIKPLKGLTKEDKNDYNITLSMQIIDEYIHMDNFQRNIAKPISIELNSSEVCEVPRDLEKVYAWHNGIDNLLPYVSLYSYKKTLDTYETIQKENESDSENKLYIPFLTDNELYGFAYHCFGRDGIYEYAPYVYERPRKVYYSIAHFLAVTSEAYQEKAYYYDYGDFKVDKKKLANIKRKYLSDRDMLRYAKLRSLLMNKVLIYDKNSDIFLKTNLIDKMSDTHDVSFIDLIKFYLNDKNEEVVQKAVYALGEVGNKSILPILFSYLENKDKTLRNFALISISKIVNKNEKDTLNKIYPLLKDEEQLVVLSALEVLDKTASKESLPYLIKGFESRKTATKMKIVEVLGKIGDKKALPVLEKYLKYVNNLDFAMPYKGGTRGSNPHPEFLKKEVEKAIKYISKH